MLFDPIALILIAVSLFILAGVLLVLVISYSKISHKLHESEQLNKHLQEQLSEKPVQLLEQAHEKSLEIIDQANKHATEILASTKSYSDTSNTALKDKLAELEKDQAAVFATASSEMKTAYQNLLIQVQEQDINTLKSITKDIENDVLADFKDFREDLEKETINSEKIVKDKIDEEYLAIEKELQEYKKGKYAQLDEDIYKILYRVSEIVLSQGITFDKHKQLVIEALETAKKEQVFK